MGKEMMIQATEIAGGQWQRFRDALKSADLLGDGIDLPGRTFFEFTQDSETVAWGGFETHGTDGLLRSLGVTGEVAEYEAATRLGLVLHPARQAGYDATETLEDGVARIQIKGRCILNSQKITGRMGAIDLRQPFDIVLLVLLDSEFNAFAMYEASRAKVEAALTLPGSKARNERGALAIRQFMSIAALRWARHEASESESQLPS